MNVILYSTQYCAECHAQSQWFDKHSIDYTKKVVDTEPEAMEEFLAVSDGIISTPFTVIQNDSGETVKVIGYDQSKLKSALNLT